jgi:hypothetical protein
MSKARWLGRTIAALRRQFILLIEALETAAEDAEVQKANAATAVGGTLVFGATPFFF